MHTNTISSLIKNYSLRFSQAGVDSPRLCAELIVAEILGLSRVQLIVFWEKEVSDDDIARCEELASRREKGEPLAYILGRKEFYGRDFIVGAGVLTPRPETELIVDIAKDRLSPKRPIFFADLGTGSGCILVSLLLEASAWKGIGLDVCKEALSTASKNIKLHKVEERATLINADFALFPLHQNSLDLMVSNPPYIPTAEYETLNFEVLNFEPQKALESGVSGLDHPRMVAIAAGHALKPGGLLLMEIGAGQGEAAKMLFQRSGEVKKSLNPWANVEIMKDLAGRDRIVVATKTENF